MKNNFEWIAIIFFNHLTTSEHDSEVLHALYTNILLAMTDSDTNLEEEIEELSVQETDAAPPPHILIFS